MRKVSIPQYRVHSCQDKHKHIKTSWPIDNKPVWTPTAQLIKANLQQEIYPHWSQTSLPCPTWQARAHSSLLALKPCISCSPTFNTASTFYKVAHCPADVTSCPRAITEQQLSSICAWCVRNNYRRENGFLWYLAMSPKGTAPDRKVNNR